MAGTGMPPGPRMWAAERTPTIRLIPSEFLGRFPKFSEAHRLKHPEKLAPKVETTIQDKNDYKTAMRNEMARIDQAAGSLLDVRKEYLDLIRFNIKLLYSKSLHKPPIDMSYNSGSVRTFASIIDKSGERNEIIKGALAALQDKAKKEDPISKSGRIEKRKNIAKKSQLSKSSTSAANIDANKSADSLHHDFDLDNAFDISTITDVNIANALLAKELTRGINSGPPYLKERAKKVLGIYNSLLSFDCALKSTEEARRYVHNSAKMAAEANTTKPEEYVPSEYHSIIKDDEKPTGESEKREFQAETRMLLEIVAKSLYSETEIFIRELISNASDALERFRYLSLAGEDFEKDDRLLEIHIETDKIDRTFTIQDTGIGMTKEEIISNLGTIARSGSKAFLDSLKNNKEGGGPGPNSIIGQFGVGFYSCFMVSSHVDVYSRSSRPGSIGYKWSSDGSGTFEIQEAEGVQIGTKIVVQLKTDFRKFGDGQIVNDIIKKYSNFVGSPIFLNGRQVNTIQALWLKDPKEVEPHLHHDFYRFIGATVDRPRFTLHFNSDVPLNLRCLLYVPEGIPGLFDMSEEKQAGVALYSRKVLIKNKADNIIPKWLRFLKGVVDSEDIPLNLSRELLQEGTVIKKLKHMVTNRMLRFLEEKGQKETEEYKKFYNDYGVFLKEGIMLESEQALKEDIAKLLRFESSTQPAGQSVSLTEYINTMQSAQRDIFYLAAPSRELAERSPYMENFRRKGVEVLYCFEMYDEMVLLQLAVFKDKPLTSVEKEMREMRDDIDMDALPLGSLTKNEAESLSLWLQQTLKGRAHSVKFTKKLESHPCVVTVQEMGSARRFLRAQPLKMSPETRFNILQPRFEVNAKHPIIKKLNILKDTNPDLAKSVANHLFINAMVEAGLEENSRMALANANELIMMTLEKQ